MENEVFDFGIKNVLDGVGNTRPPNTSTPRLRALVDWVSVGFDLNGDFEDVCDLIGLGKLEFDSFDWGTDTYTSHIRFSNIVIQKKYEFNYQLYLSGQGCREFEEYSTLDWIQLFSILKDFCNAKATRFDLALDDFTPYYSVNMIRRTFLDGRCRTRMRKARVNQDYDTKSLALTMDSFYLGSIKSRLSINFYDKKLEREANGFEVTEESWTRTELRCKREYADDVIDILLINDDIGAVLMGILKRHVSFIKKSKQKNKSRVEFIKWWADFLKGVEGIQLSVKAPDKTIEKTRNWFIGSVAPSFATLQKAYDPEEFAEFMKEALEGGAERLNQKHESMIKQYDDEKYKKAKQKIIEINGEMNENPNLQQRILTKIQQKNADQ